MLPTREVTGAVYTPDGQPAAGATIYAQLSEFEIDSGVVVPEIVTAKADDQGAYSIALWPNERGATGSSYAVSIRFPGADSVTVRIVVPEGDGPVPMVTLIDQEPFPELTAAQLAVSQAQEFAREAFASAQSISITEEQLDTATMTSQQAAQAAIDAAGEATAGAQAAQAVAGDLGTLAGAVSAAQTAASTAVQAETVVQEKTTLAVNAAGAAAQIQEEIEILAGGVSKWRAVTQAQYNALTPAADVLYIIVG